MTDAALPPSSRSRLADLGFGVVLVGVVVRMTATFDPMPAWSGDPFTSAAPIVGLTPALSMLLDAAVLIGAWLVLASAAGRGRSIVIASAVAAVGVAPALFHALSRDSNTLDDTVIASAWLAAIVGAVAVWAACRDEQRWRIAAAVLLGSVGVLAAKGLVQNYIDHPETVAMYRQNRDAILAANGWSPDSAMARAYERRLLNAEATGWFGLSNVYASFMAAAAVSGAGLLAFARTRNTPLPRPTLLLAGVLAVGGIAGLLLTGSKGAIAAAGLGLGLVILAIAARRLKAVGAGKAAAVIVAAAVLLPLMGVALMALLPEAKANLSLLFRWFYIVGASRTIAMEPLIGVGPAGFKEAYQILKPPISPEDVSSPHSMAFDWIAAFGIFGVAWVGLAIAAASFAARAMLTADNAAPAHVDAPTASRDIIRAVFLITALGTAAAAATEIALATPEASLVRVVGLLVWVLAAVAVGRRDIPIGILSAALGAGGLVLLAHAQIEMTPASVTSALTWAAWLAVAASGVWIGRGTTLLRRSVAWIAPSGALVLVLLALPGVLGWERSLRAAAAEAAPVAAASQRAGVLATSGRWSGPEGREFAEALSAQLGRRISPTPVELERAIADLRARGVEAARPGLEAAADRFPVHGPTARALSRLYLDLAFAAGDPARRDELAARAVEIATQAAQAGGGSSGWGWVGTLHRTIMSVDGVAQHLAGAIDAYERAAAAGPYSVLYPVELARLHAQAGRPAEAARWATRALELQELTRLDPLVGLNDRQQREMRAFTNP